jgi:acyl transferase domain-containing protein
VEYGHFVKDDIAGFDAPFFGMQPGEVACTDPAQRWLLEVTYEALENGRLLQEETSGCEANLWSQAGITLQQIKGPRTSVFIGSFFQEYHTLLNRDPEMQAKYKAPGTALSMLANRLSWFYDLQGPSITLDTACSSSLSAFHLACQSIKAGKSDIVNSLFLTNCQVSWLIIISLLSEAAT